MNYVLVYSVDGVALSSGGFTSLDEINREIRSIYEHVSDPVSILRIEEHHDGPRTWAIEYPPAPPAGTRVKTGNGDVLTVRGEGESTLVGTYSWKGALEQFGPLTEVVETEVQAAARRLREAGFNKDLKRPLFDYFDELQTVVVHVLNGGQL